jgi:hypothetical protein
MNQMGGIELVINLTTAGRSASMCQQRSRNGGKSDGRRAPPAPLHLTRSRRGSFRYGARLLGESGIAAASHGGKVDLTG